MNFVDHSYNLFTRISETDFTDNYKNKDQALKSLVNKINEIFSSEDLKKYYNIECDDLIKTKLVFFETDLNSFRKLKSVSSYQNSMSFYTLIYLCWIWSHNFEINKIQLTQLTRAIYIDSLGYKFLDEATDNLSGKSDLFYLGLHLIRLAEELYSEILPNSNVYKIMTKHIQKYSEFEYIEKKNRWHTCPFDWNEAHMLGHKASPMYSIFEIIAENFKLESTKTENIIKGMIFTTAGMQIMDDFGDAFEDLNNGTESLVMSGYYSKYGTKTNVTNSNIQDFLDQDRLMKIYKTALTLFNNARTIFKDNNEDILILFNELQNYKFNKIFNPVYENN